MNDLYTAVVHDVKNQLAELALRLGKRKDAQHEMAMVMGAARRLSEMLLVYQDAENLLQVNTDSVSPEDFLAILTAEYRELFPALTINVVTDRAPACAFFDDALVRLALSNALHNACRHARTAICVSAYQEEEMLVFSIVDDGEGFSEDVLASQGRTPTASRGTGTGLGLYLAHKIALRHRLQACHGTIRLSNEPGGCFRMFLP